MVVITKGKDGADGIRTINLAKGNETNKALNELGLILTDIVKDFIPSRTNEDDYINVDDIEIKDREIREKSEDIVEEAE